MESLYFHQWTTNRNPVKKQESILKIKHKILNKLWTKIHEKMTQKTVWKKRKKFYLPAELYRIG